VYVTGGAKGAYGPVNPTGGELTGDSLAFVAAYDAADGDLERVVAPFDDAPPTDGFSFAGPIDFDDAGNVLVLGSRQPAASGVSTTSPVLVAYSPDLSVRRYRTTVAPWAPGVNEGWAGGLDVMGPGQGRPGSEVVGCNYALFDRSDPMQREPALPLAQRDLFHSAWVAVFDAASGTQRWLREFGTVGLAEYAWDCAFGPDGSVFVVGATDGDLAGTGNAGSTDGWIRKYSADGAVLWTRQLGTARSDFVQAIDIDDSGRMFIAGITSGDLFGPNGCQAQAGCPLAALAAGSDVFVAEIDPSSGDTLQGAQLGTEQFDVVNTIAADGGVLTLGGFGFGSVNAPNAGASDTFVLRLSDAGLVPVE
jgi:hypothetical protein